MAITIVNNTGYEAFLSINKGDLVIANWARTGSSHSLEIPTHVIGTILAKANFQNREYVSDRMQLNDTAAYVAQIEQDLENKSYVLRVVESGSSAPPFMQLYKTCTPPVSFIIQMHGLFEQEITQSRGFIPYNLRSGPAYTLQAVINGITLPPVHFSDENATITAETVQHDPAAGFYRLDVVQSKI
ncbi:hypothetical protein ACO0LG_08150 [Undibacterium sp. Ji42W]|uniref:hypothetical protein n=1 Tax=Undibacterium sp. Ji42W TaxID=3413039 RepID=UPI003BF3BAF1